MADPVLLFRYSALVGFNTIATMGIVTLLSATPLGWAGGKVISTCYAHQSRYATSQGASVSAGQVIGYVGCTGHCFGDHLHFEVRINGSAVDPMGYL